jgi:hypothetical protein
MNNHDPHLVPLEEIEPNAFDDAGFYDPPGEPPKKFEPIASRDNLLVAAWRERELPPRDYLSGEVLCSTSRVLLNGATGIGKTLFCLDWGAAIAAGVDFLDWKGRRRARVLYLDGELPAETFKERMELIGNRYGDDIELFGYNRDVLTPDEMPPLNTDTGRAWLLREIETTQPDVIFFDSIMCLLGGNMSEEDSWAPIKDLVRQISSRRIAQIWLHHTGHDASRGYGTKTREWEMDTVIMLSKAESEDDAPEISAAFRLEFTKARMKTPANYRQFAAKTVRSTEFGFVAEEGVRAPNTKETSKGEKNRRAFRDAYANLADGVTPSPGFDGAPVRKVKTDAIREEMRSRGFLQTDDKGNITATGRSDFHRAKTDLLIAKRFAESEGLLWRTD